MPDLPRIFAQPGTAYQRHIPESTPETYGAGLFHTLGQLADAMIEKQKPIDAAMASSEYDIKMNDAINSLPADSDPNVWRQTIMQKEQEIRQELTQKYTNTDVQKALALHADRNYANNINHVSELQIKASHAKQMDDIATVGATLAKTAGESDDPNVRLSATNTYNSLLNAAAATTTIEGRPVPASINTKAAEELRQNFQKDVLRNRAKFLAESDPYKLKQEIANGVYKNLPMDEEAQVMSAARIGVNNAEAATEKNAAKNREVILKASEAQANFGKLDENFIQNAMQGNDPYLTPADGRHLKELNDNPPGTTAGDDASVRAIMEDYHAGSSSFKRILDARAQLNHLRKQQVGPNKILDKALDELQTDERTMLGIDASAQNRRMQAAHDEYDAANAPNLPFLNRLIPDKSKQDKAKIDNAIRKGQDYSPLIKRQADQNKSRVESIPQKYKDVMAY